MGKLIRRAVEADLPMHEPLCFPIYDENERLLLRQGFVITIPGFVERLLQRGCYIGSVDHPSEILGRSSESKQQEGGGAEQVLGGENFYPEKPRTPVFLRTADLTISVRRIHKLLQEVPSDRVVLQDFVRDCARKLLGLIAEDRDAVLASAYLTHDVRDSRVNQQLLGAVVAALLAPQCELSEDQQLSLICAAFTRDVALHSIDKSYATACKLPDTALVIVREHPVAAVKLLLRHGVNDRDWLTYVVEHHERLDGGGYPHGKKGDAIHSASLLLGLADAYAGMVLANLRRPGIFPANALKEIYLGKGSQHQEKQVIFLLTTLTRFPAGTLVLLVNGEIGVVKHSPSSQSQPQVYSLYDLNGILRSSPVIRDSAQSEFEISGCVTPEKCKSAELVIRRLWQ